MNDALHVAAFRGFHVGDILRKDIRDGDRAGIFAVVLVRDVVGDKVIRFDDLFVDLRAFRVEYR